MRTDITHLEQYRHTKEGTSMATKEGDRFGVFFIRNAATSFVMIFDCGEGGAGVEGSGWEHLSFRAVQASSKNRTPTWEECCWAKQLFWDEEEVCLQFHPAKSSYVNIHDNVLHIWRHKSVLTPMPPEKAV